MKSKLFPKIIITLLVVFFIISMFSNFAYADNFDLTGFESEAASSIKTPVEDVVGAIIGVMRIICTGIAIIMIMTLSIKYIVSSPGERAEIKKSAVQYAIGAVVLFGAAGILTVLEGVVTRVVNQ